MLIKYKKLIELPVVTQSGEHLGKVCDLDIEVNVHQVKKYLIKSVFWAKPLVIDFSQVISINTKQMVVEDALLKEKGLLAKVEEKLSKAALPQVNTKSLTFDKNSINNQENAQS